MKLSRLPVNELLAAFRSPSPTPGGGSASALAGALGAALLAMVASMPRHRAASADEGHRLEAAADRCAEISARLETLVDEDSQAYEQVVAAYRLPKVSPEEKTERSRRIQEALRTATEVPLDVMRRCVEAIEAAATVAALGNPNASSDVGVALELLSAAVRGAGMNVGINLATISDAAYADGARRQADAYRETADRERASTRTLLTF